MKKNKMNYSLSNQRAINREEVKELQEFVGLCGLKRIKAIQKFVRSAGYFVYVEEFDGTLIKRLTIWTEAGAPFQMVESTLRLNKLWPIVSVPTEPKEKLTAVDIFKRSLGSRS